MWLCVRSRRMAIVPDSQDVTEQIGHVLAADRQCSDSFLGHRWVGHCRWTLGTKDFMKFWSKWWNLPNFDEIWSNFDDFVGHAEIDEIWSNFGGGPKKWRNFRKMSASPVLAILFLGDFQVNLPLIRRNWPKFDEIWHFLGPPNFIKFWSNFGRLGTFGPKRSPRMVTKYPPTINTSSARTLDDFAILLYFLNLSYFLLSNFLFFDARKATCDYALEGDVWLLFLIAKTSKNKSVMCLLRIDNTAAAKKITGWVGTCRWSRGPNFINFWSKFGQICQNLPKFHQNLGSPKKVPKKAKFG